METWQQILHDIGTITAAAAAAIAAVSSLKNGRTLKRNTNGDASATSATMNGSKGKDWYPKYPPHLKK